MSQSKSSTPLSYIKVVAAAAAAEDDDDSICCTLGSVPVLHMCQMNHMCIIICWHEIVEYLAFCLIYILFHCHSLNIHSFLAIAQALSLTSFLNFQSLFTVQKRKWLQKD